MLLECERGADRTDVRVRLRKVAELRTGAWIDFFGHEAEVVRVRARVFEQAPRFVALARAREVLDGPEATDPKRALLVSDAARVALKQPGPDGQLLADAFERR